MARTELRCSARHCPIHTPDAELGHKWNGYAIGARLLIEATEIAIEELTTALAADGDGRLRVAD